MEKSIEHLRWSEVMLTCEGESTAESRDCGETLGHHIDVVPRTRVSVARRRGCAQLAVEEWLLELAKGTFLCPRGAVKMFPGPLSSGFARDRVSNEG